MKKNNTTRFVAESAVIAAVYTALTLAFAPISFGAIQFRIAEALCVMPYFTLAGVPGITLGCLLGNILGGAALPDIIFGTLATLLGAVLSYRLRTVSRWLVCVPPILSNALIIPFVLRIAYGIQEGFLFLMGTVAAGEILAVGVLGGILMTALESRKEWLFPENSRAV